MANQTKGLVIVRTQYRVGKNTMLAMLGFSSVLGDWTPQNAVIAAMRPNSENWEACLHIERGVTVFWKWVILETGVQSVRIHHRILRLEPNYLLQKLSRKNLRILLRIWRQHIAVLQILSQENKMAVAGRQVLRQLFYLTFQLNAPSETIVTPWNV